MELSDLKDGVRVLAKFAKRDTEDGGAPDYSAPREVTLHVERCANNIRARGRVVRPAGGILLLAVKEVSGAWASWAEYTESDYCGDGEFLVENWRMKILEIKG